MELKDKSIGFALTASYCTFSKIIKQIENLVAVGAIVTPIMSENAASTDTRFGRAIDFINILENITSNKVIKTVKDAEPIGPKALFDLLIIAPCTGNTLAKLALGVTDSSVTMAAKAHLRNQLPLLIAVSSNDGLAGSAKNIGALLNMKNIYFVPFEQDDFEKKPRSLVAKMDMIMPSALMALEGKQMQPIM